MKVSVLLPIYRTNEAFLREALESVLKQTFADFELLLLDDCPENTREAVVREFADERIVYLKNETNLGIAGSRNKLVSRAKGEYIAVLDHDDIALPTRFEEQVKFLDANPEVGVVGSWTEEFPKKRTIRWPQTHEAIVARLTQGSAIPHTGAMIRRAVLEGVKYEQEFSPAEDYALWYRLIGKTRFYNLPKVLTRYRRHKRNTSIVASDEMRKATKKIRKLIATNHPEFLNQVKTRAKYVVRMKLFGLIPIGKFTQVGEKRRGILKFLPFVMCKAKLAEAFLMAESHHDENPRDFMLRMKYALVGATCERQYRRLKFWWNSKFLKRLPRLSFRNSNKIALVCIAKDEEHYIKEWVDYHLKLGFDDIFIYQNDWRAEQFDNPRVHLIEMDGEARNMVAYNHFLLNYRYDFAHVAVMDVDEFLALPKNRSIRDFLRDYESYAAVGINWIHFGDNGYDKVTDGNYSVLERFTRSAVKPDHRIKTILNLRMVCRNRYGIRVRYTNPHFVTFDQDTDFYTIAVDKKTKIVGPWHETEELHPRAWINHYFGKTLEEYKSIKQKRGKVDFFRDSDKWAYLEQSWHERNQNEVENTVARDFMREKEL